jgi:OmpA-OmpF porin, OOP family
MKQQARLSGQHRLAPQHSTWPVAPGISRSITNKENNMKTMTKFVLAAFTAVALIPAIAVSAPMESKNQGYLVDTNGSGVVMSGTGLCWHSSEWTPASTSQACGGVSPAAAIPAPAPIVVAAVTPQVAITSTQKTSFSGDALFAFDQAVLKPEGKTTLDVLVHQLEGATYDKIVTTGHTDRFGSANYNQDLSERRARAVKDYLVSQNIDASRITASGMGKTQPVTNAADCTGKQSIKVVACLQPDRRVDIEMTGTRTVVGSL